MIGTFHSKEMRPGLDPNVADGIRRDITSHDVVLFMKGTSAFPQDSFSAQAVQILGFLGVSFKGIDVLTDPSLRQGIKDFTDWPTLPQLYVKTVFIGGADIMREMTETGELQQLFADNGIPMARGD